MSKSFRLEVITPERLFYSGQAELVIVKTDSGEEGYMADHTWAVKLLQPGQLRIQEEGADRKNMKYAAISEGYIVVEDSIMIFTDAAEWPEEIDLARAERAKMRAESMLQQIRPDDSEHAKLEVALHRAINRIRVKGGGNHLK